MSALLTLIGFKTERFLRTCLSVFPGIECVLLCSRSIIECVGYTKFNAPFAP